MYLARARGVKSGHWIRIDGRWQQVTDAEEVNGRHIILTDKRLLSYAAGEGVLVAENDPYQEKEVA